MIQIQASTRISHFTRLIPRVHLHRRSHTAATAPDPHEDLFRYTTGRWLWGEAEQLRKRYRRFNVVELQNAATRALEGSPKCVSMSKVSEGNSNRVFRLQMDDGRVVVARIPMPNAGPERYTTASEAATMEFEPEGTQLGELWRDMKPFERKTLIESIVGLEQKLLSVGLNRSGSIYFAESGFEGCKTAEIITDAPSSLRDYVKDRFVIGPSVDEEYWENQKANMAIDRGPWDTAEEYVKAIAHREMAWIPRYGSEYPRDARFTYDDGQQSPEAHIDLLQRYLSVISMLLPKKRDLLRPTLWHYCIDEQNVFVRNGVVSGLVDWQSTLVAPLVLQARVPWLVRYRRKKVFKRPDNFKELDEADQEKVLTQIARTTQQDFYLTQAALENPLLSRALDLPQSEFLKYLVSFAGWSWNNDNGFLNLRESLLKVIRRWELFNMEDPCPYRFSNEEIEQHRKDGEGFNEYQDFWDELEGVVDREGFTFPETFDAAVDFFSDLRDVMLKEAEGKNREELDLWTRWVLERKQEREAKK
ncbi:predicted protein [Uncinocarpus reesii 1704]|uniref:Aminoglycoside phosphotransferase domain-containing protein n=1 Tax=Uncinocarpus reesii (strain UAMH 1704) TaxID=336963 RepID=C4JID8_UNCRE|nr:uncharacterized protein UREG_01475 [Uncinocarpus reesii 1704]EEP76626.1 predicted protein [Uncinocarpus reesii 1704]